MGGMGGREFCESPDMEHEAPEALPELHLCSLLPTMPCFTAASAAGPFLWIQSPYTPTQVSTELIPIKWEFWTFATIPHVVSELMQFFFPSCGILSHRAWPSRVL